MLKSTKRKVITSLISLTACLSMIGVGFSAWSAGGGSGAGSADGDLVTDEFSKISVKVDSIAVDPFCQDGFLSEYNNGYKIVYTGHIKAYFTLDLSNYVRSATQTMSVNAIFTSAGNKNPSIFFDLSKVDSWTYGYGTSSNPTLSSPGSTLSGSTASVVYADISVPTSATKYYFGMDFVITGVSATFADEIYTYLYDAKFSLDVGYTIS